MKAFPQTQLFAGSFAQVEDREPWEGELTLVFDELMEEAGLPRPGAADHEELEQEV